MVNIILTQNKTAVAFPIITMISMSVELTFAKCCGDWKLLIWLAVNAYVY